MMFIDTHCHLSLEDYDDINKVILENRSNNVSKIIISGCTAESILESIDITSKYDDVFVTIGFHPSEATITTEKELNMLDKFKEFNKVVGIGEIGLDYHYGKEDKEKQIELFSKQLKFAEENNFPVVIHSRDAVEDTINILKQYKVRGIIHCFSGSIETAKRYVSMGYLLGIGGVVTFKNSNLYKVVEEVGLENIVLETDSPYLAPEPFRGSQNSSKYLVYIAEKIAQTLNVDVAKVAEVTSSNATKLFDLK